MRSYHRLLLVSSILFVSIVEFNRNIFAKGLYLIFKISVLFPPSNYKLVRLKYMILFYLDFEEKNIRGAYLL